MKGGPLLVSGLVHLGLVWALASVDAPRPAARAQRMIVFEPVHEARTQAEPAPEPEPEPAPEPEPEPEPVPEPQTQAPAQRPASAPAQPPSPPPLPAPESSSTSEAAAPLPPAREGPRRLDLTLSNAGQGSGEGSSAGSGEGAGRGGGAAASPGCAEARTKPKPISRVTIEYPAAARAAGLEGRVVLQALVDARGEVREVEVLESAGAQIDGPASAALGRWRFEPATRCGEPVEAPYVIAREFRLGD